jgi:hypothetical protein
MKTNRKSQNSMFFFGMRAATSLAVLALTMLLIPCSAGAIVIDGINYSMMGPSQGKELEDYAGFVDVVGSTLDSSRENPWTAKGNAFWVSTNRMLVKEEFFLNFTTTQTLSFYVYESSIEFGTYNQIHKNSYVVAGDGADWYSSGPLHVPLDAGNFYIMALSWNGSLEYYFSVGESQAVSFGSQVHGYATGFDPLGDTISSTVDDYAIYYQRLTTVPEPATICLLGLGVLSLLRRKR